MSQKKQKKPSIVCFAVYGIVIGINIWACFVVGCMPSHITQRQPETEERQPQEQEEKYLERLATEQRAERLERESHLFQDCMVSADEGDLYRRAIEQYIDDNYDDPTRIEWVNFKYQRCKAEGDKVTWVSVKFRLVDGQGLRKLHYLEIRFTGHEIDRVRRASELRTPFRSY